MTEVRAGIDPGTFGTEGMYLPSELPRQMRERILISIYGLLSLLEASRVDSIRPSLCIENCLPSYGKLNRITRDL